MLLESLCERFFRTRTAAIAARLRAPSLAALALAALGGVTAGARDAAADVTTRYTAERFELTGHRDGILGVEWADARGHLTYDAGVWLGYANDPINVYDMSTGERLGALVHGRMGGDLVAAFRLWDRLELGVGAPMIVSQSADLDGAAAMIGNDVSGSGFGDLRLASKVTVARRGGTALAVMAGLSLPTSTLDDYGGDHGLLVSPALAVSHARGGLRLAANVGYRARPAAEALNLKVDDEVYARTGVGYRFASSLEVDATFDVATGASDVLGAFNRNHAELRGGVAYDLTSAVRVFGATGAGVAEGFGTPDWRALVGVRLAGGSSKPRRPIRLLPEPPPPAPVPEPAPAPMIDGDRDTIADLDDRCPTEPGTKEHQGCPVNTRLDKELGKLVILERVEFATDADTILPRSFPILQEVAVILTAYPDIKRLLIEGHTDSEGAAAYNLDLSKRRVHSVKQWLVEIANIDAARLEARGCGESLPIADNATADGRQENRRVEFPILDPAPLVNDERDTTRCSTVE
jgi:outer membrane protein OmpA-like peptidoglycan-associated protein